MYKLRKNIISGAIFRALFNYKHKVFQGLIDRTLLIREWVVSNGRRVADNGWQAGERSTFQKIVSSKIKLNL